MTRREYLELVCACAYYYDEGIYDLDVIQPLDDSDNAKDFLDYIKAKKMKQYGCFLSMPAQPSLWEYLEKAEESVDDVDMHDLLKLLSDYAVYNPKFGESSYKEAKEWMDINGYDIKEGYKEWIDM